MPRPCKPNFADLDSSPVLTWKTISPSAQLMVDPKIGARAVIRDTRADAGRFLWSVLAGDEMYPVSEGRTDDLARAQSIAEAALHAYAESRARSVHSHQFLTAGAIKPTRSFPTAL
jgi:hypothetical protein